PARSACRTLGFLLSDLLPKLERAEDEEQSRNDDEDHQLWPVLKKMRAAENDSPGERYEIRRRQQSAQRVKNPRHGFARKNETGEENARQHEGHRHLKRLHLVFGLGGNEQAKAEQSKHVNKSGEHHRKNISSDRNVKHEAHN